MIFKSFFFSREKKRDKDREELWTRLDKLAVNDVGSKERSTASLPASQSATTVNSTAADDKGRKST